MPCTVKKHAKQKHNALNCWPSGGDLTIHSCERYCGYCVTPKREENVHNSTNDLKRHVYSIHIDPKQKGSHATHPDVNIVGFK